MKVVGLLLLLGMAGCASRSTPATPAPTLAPQVILSSTAIAAALTPPTSLPLAQASPPAPGAANSPAPAGPPGPTPATLIGTPVPPPPLTGKFVFAPGDGSIWLTDAATGQAQALLASMPGSFPDAPNFSADGNQVVYTLGKFMPNNQVQYSIHVMDTKGSYDRTLITPADPLTELSWPVFSPDGKWVYYTTTQPAPPNGATEEIHRVGVDGRGAQKVLDDAEQAAFSPDGKQLVYLRFSSTTYTSALWVSDAEGHNPRRIMADNIFSSILAPRFSPDGEWIVFSASGPPAQPLPGALALPRRNCEPVWLCALAQPAHADGLPWDLWLAKADGTRFQQLTNVGFDSPWPAWSRDGKYIAIFEISGFYVLDVNRRLLSQWQPVGGHGVMDWWTPKSQ